MPDAATAVDFIPGLSGFIPNKSRLTPLAFQRATLPVSDGYVGRPCRTCGHDFSLTRNFARFILGTCRPGRGRATGFHASLLVLRCPHHTMQVVIPRSLIPE